VGRAGKKEGGVKGKTTWQKGSQTVRYWSWGKDLRGFQEKDEKIWSKKKELVAGGEKGGKGGELKLALWGGEGAHAEIA